jgi:hypothetical protein
MSDSNGRTDSTRAEAADAWRKWLTETERQFNGFFQLRQGFNEVVEALEPADVLRGHTFNYTAIKSLGEIALRGFTAN